MNRFTIVRIPSLKDASNRVATTQGAVLRAGGIDLLDHMKEGLQAPSELVELHAIGGDEGMKLRSMDVHGDGRRRLGALVTLAQIAELEELFEGHQALAQAAAHAATPGIRNAATLGGNLLQRPRCWYYRHVDLVCLKKGGDMCLAQTGDHRYHAILGGGPSYIVHPSSLAGPLVALEATIDVRGVDGTVRTIAIEELFVGPTVDPMREHCLAPGEILLSVTLPVPAPGQRSAHAMAKEKQSQDWPLAEASVRLRMDGGKLRDVRVALGHVAPVPWRSKEAEAALEGQAPSAELFARAAQAATGPAKPLPGNAYKVPLCQGVLRQALHEAAQIPLPE
ncbi:FAD binding domain-containing protein [Paraliomyxa miuraensis]|uniref:FAD binding domain-containing protein n=1 Tax=Paraliomyxa miuraensis TaxID=376150 RepID=UPI0022579915|nr:FAD binding domain-containing protein [Paraliomyxa miuraensis]MCX4244924.1 FAD binding domain-containing protein [Paraliomyxa miuraensis]